MMTELWCGIDADTDLNPRGGCCSEPGQHHCTPAWATTAKLHLKHKNKNKLAGLIPAAPEAEAG